MTTINRIWQITLFPWANRIKGWNPCNGRRFSEQTATQLAYLWYAMSGRYDGDCYLPKLSPLQDAAGGQVSYFIADNVIDPQPELYMLGQVELFPAHWEMPGWIKCDGQLLKNYPYYDLLSVLGARFGGNGSTTFAVPQLPPVQFSIGGMEIKLAYYIAYKGYRAMPESLLGQIVLYTDEPPYFTWLKCDGRLLSTAEYNALFSLLGTRFGGDGNTTFGLPNLPALQTPSGAEVPYYICVRGGDYPEKLY